MSSVLNEWLFREMPNSRSCDGFSERLQTVLFTMGDPVLNPVYNANADTWHVQRELVMAGSAYASQRALSRDSVMVCSPPPRADVKTNHYEHLVSARVLVF